jgi:hypothetical protein
MEQTRLVAGDTLHYSRSVPGHLPADGWQLQYRLAPRAGGGSVIEIAAAASGDEFVVRVGPGTTAAWAPGVYGWGSWVQRVAGGGAVVERYTIAQGQLEVLPNPATLAAGADTRTSAQKALDDARVALHAWNPTVRRYRIGEREREFNSVAEIVRLITELERDVEREAQLSGRGERLGRRIHTRL